jgi:hypothetical protein
MKVSTESMSASASSSFAAGTAAAITGRLTAQCGDAAVRAPPLRWFLPKDAHGGSVCDGGVGEEVEVEGRKLGEARARSISAGAVGMLCFFRDRVAFGWCSFSFSSVTVMRMRWMCSVARPWFVAGKADVRGWDCGLVLLWLSFKIGKICHGLVRASLFFF